MTVVAKMGTTSIEDFGTGRRLKLTCVYDGRVNTGDSQENRSFTKATPWGECVMSIDNKHAVDQFRLATPENGFKASQHYVLFIDAEKNSLEDVMNVVAQLR